jgi:hypothetical protein
MLCNTWQLYSCVLSPPPQKKEKENPHGSAWPKGAQIFHQKLRWCQCILFGIFVQLAHEIVKLSQHKVDVLESPKGGTLFKSQHWHLHSTTHCWYIQVNDATTRSLILTGHIYLSSMWFKRTPSMPQKLIEYGTRFGMWKCVRKTTKSQIELRPS